MKILLINPPLRTKAYDIPIGLGIIAQVLLNEGHEVKILDIFAEQLSKSKVIERINLNSEYKIIGIGSLINMYKYLKWLIPIIKEYNPDSKIVVGGGVITQKPKLLLKNTPADIAVIGEGELTMKEVVSALEDNKSLKTVKGIYYKDDNQIIVNPPRPLIKNLDELPFPAYDLFPIDIYLHNVKRANLINKKTELSIISARGCPYNCNFCFHIYGRGIRERSIDSVIEEIEFLKDKYKVESIMISDESFSVRKKRIMEFCNKMIIKKIDLPWSCNSRVNLVDRELLRRMKQAGCFRIMYGIESGSQKILNNMNKQFNLEQAKNAIKITIKEGIICKPTFMFGYPGENLKTIKETINFCRKFVISPQFFYATPFPGTTLYNQVRGKILEKFGTEENFIENLVHMHQLNINLTDFSDEKLVELRKKTVKFLRKKPFYKYPKSMFYQYKQFGLNQMLNNYFKSFLRKLSKRYEIFK
ncbi:MAG: B12-binding domain-containing radical SAM protein [Promethearchaeota archaeon]